MHVTLMKNSANAPQDDPEKIVDAIVALAARESNDFRTFVGDATRSVMELRKSVPVEQYLDTMLKDFK